MPLPPSPLKLSHRYPSAMDDSPISPGTSNMNGFALQSPRSPQTPRLSAPPSPIASRHNSTALSGSHRGSGDFSGAAEAGVGGLGNLADELADAWDQEDDGYGYASGQENGRAGSQQMDQSDMEDAYMQSVHDMRTRSPSPSPERDSLHPGRTKNRANHLRQHRRQESQYDGSDYGPDSDLDEAADISPALENQMAEIESLVRRGIENNGSENDLVIQRTVESLKDLGGQSGIENSAMRLITAHSSITSHLTHQTRTLQSLIHPLLFSPFPLLSEDAIDSLMPLIDEGLLPNLPYPFPEQSRRGSRPTTPLSSAHNPLVSLQALIAQTADITHSLRGLSDTLYESRQLTSTASRRLRSARELVAEIRREEESREEGSRWIERGEWDRRLKDREAGKVCGDVVSGFEAVCGEWREKLFGANAEVAAA
ncbi:hypothetical protein N7499_007609 [Penicillium canescens]|uniref:Uncharacterized protein n=1 Tax=Penicillium canescens TaxID=5083 RepID=A0AAD6IFQ6_PENCN|nr:uncharacterized protein N7446_003307 [Penicillium canescens]KAJ6045105.1 hypothetical protein N7460_006460 [Penicillium canescens]KAJ6075530.1 hypothetical protein N7446_003307 [Penicillium canescens]KAJ6082735.1 hypothetical protein N7499_007609 [Penicillium canescens]KAJ6175465.1 hypothetical protein N7485_002379 [Penicillium canescens]